MRRAPGFGEAKPPSRGGVAVATARFAPPPPAHPPRLSSLFPFTRHPPNPNSNSSSLAGATAANNSDGAPPARTARRNAWDVAAAATGGGRRTSASTGGGGKKDAGADAFAAEAEAAEARLASEIERELEQRGLTDDQLAAALRERGVPVRGGRDNRLRRLARALAHEQQQQQGAAPPTASAPAAAAAAAAVAAAAAADADAQTADDSYSSPAAAADPGRRAYLVADRQQRLVDELLEVPRAELRALLAASGQDAAEDEPLSRLAQRAAWLLAEEEVAMMEARTQQQQQQQQPGGKGGAAPPAGAAAHPALGAADAVAAAASPAEALAVVQSQDVRMMRVADLRACLRALGFSDEGGRYELRDRLSALLAVHEAARRGDRADLRRRLQGMTLRELANELRRRGLDAAEGGKAQLTDRLAAALAASGGLVEALPEGAAAAAGSGGGGGGEGASLSAGGGGGADALEAAALAAAEAAQRAPLDPTGTVALVVVASGLLWPDGDEEGPGEQRRQGQQQPRPPSSPAAAAAAAPLALAEALASARALVAALHTAPFDALDAHPLAATAAGPGGDSAGAEPQAAGQAAAQGLRVDVYVVAAAATAAAAGGRGGASAAAAPSLLRLFRMRASLLSALSDADLGLLLLAGGEGVESFGTDAAALAGAARRAGTAAALSVLPTGAGAGLRSAAAGVAAALGEAGVPVLGGAGHATPRAATLARLLELGYPVQPVQAFGAEALEQADREAAEAAAAEAARQEKENGSGDGDGGGGNSSSSNGNGNGNGAGPLSPSQARIAEELTAWCEAHGYDPDTQLLLVSADDGGSGFGGGVAASAAGGARFACGAGRAAAAAVQVWARAGRAHGCAGVLVEPHPHVRDGWTAWEVTVLPALAAGGGNGGNGGGGGGDGRQEAVALPAAELELYDTDALYLRHELDLAEWRLMRDGAGPEAVAKGAARLEARSEPDPAFAGAPLAPPGVAPAREHRVLKVHCPPRASRKVAHALRHAATKAALELGLFGGGGGAGDGGGGGGGGGGAVRVRGWMRVDPSWQEADAAAAVGGAGPLHLRLPTLPDPLQPEILAEAAAERAAADAASAAPLGDYYLCADPRPATAAGLLAAAASSSSSASSSRDYGVDGGLAAVRAPDLARFDPAARLSSLLNGGEADVCIAAVEALAPGAALPEHRGSVPAAQAAEAGLLPGALARHLLNVALARATAAAAGPPAPLSRLPPPPPVDRSEAAQWASLTGANADAAAVRAAFDAADEREAALAEGGAAAGAELLGGEMFFGVQEGRVGLGPDDGLGSNAYGVATRTVAWSADTPRVYSGDMTAEEMGLAGSLAGERAGQRGAGLGGSSGDSSPDALLPPGPLAAAQKEALLAQTFVWLAGPAAAAQLFPAGAPPASASALLRSPHPGAMLAAAEAAALAAGADGAAAAPQARADGAAALRDAGPLPPIPADAPTQDEKEARRAAAAGGADADARAAARRGVALDRYPGEPLGAWAAELGALADAAAAASGGSEPRAFLVHEAVPERGGAAGAGLRALGRGELVPLPGVAGVGDRGVGVVVGGGGGGGGLGLDGAAHAQDEWLLGPSAEQEAAEAAASARKRAKGLARLSARRARVWVLAGGCGADRQAALAAGLDEAGRLSRHRDLQVDAFLLPPAAGAASAPGEAGEARRRAALLARRTEWLSIGVPESDMPFSMRRQGLVSSGGGGGGGGADGAGPHAPSPALAHAGVTASAGSLRASASSSSALEPPPAHRLVLALSAAAAARSTVEEAAEASERGRERGGGARAHGVRGPARHQREALEDAQVELSAAGVGGVAGAWGAAREGAAHRVPLPPLAPFLEGEPGGGGGGTGGGDPDADAADADDARGLHPDSFLARRARERAYARRLGRALPAALSAAPPARCWDVDAWLAEARDCGATVVLALGGDEPLASGPLQRLMDAAGVAYVGPGPAGAGRCASRVAANAALQAALERGEEGRGGAAASPGGEASAPPQQLLPTRTLLRAAAHEADARALLGRLRAGAPKGATSLCLRPRLASGGGAGVVRVATPGDLRALGAALSRRAPSLPASSLSLPQPRSGAPLSASGPLTGAAAVPLPPGLPDAFVVEPWVETDAVEVADGGEVRWAGRHRWVEVVIGVFSGGGAAPAPAPPPGGGGLGATTDDAAAAAAAASLPFALPPVLVATSAASGARAHLCPAPAHVLSAGAAEAAQRAAVRAAAAVAGEPVAGAAGVGLPAAPPPGLVQVDAFCHADTGDLIVLDVRARPALRDGHPLLLAASRAGLLPHALARRSADAGAAAGARAFGGGSGEGGGGGASAAYWLSGGGEAALGLAEEGGDGGILAGAPSFLGGDTDAEGADATEEEVGAGAGAGGWSL